MQGWATYYATIGAASATLLGLLFVAVSVNAAAALGDRAPLTRAMTEQAFQNYLAVMLVALLALFPQIEPRTFAAICFFAAAGRAVWVGLRLYQTLAHKTAPPPLWLALRRHLSAIVGFGLLLFASGRMALGRGTDFNEMAAATLVLLFSATTVSWELLRRIANPLAD